MLRPLLIALLLTATAAVHAEGDGHYCAGPDFLAMEFVTARKKAPHILKIARFDAKRGPRWAGQMVLEPFDTHSLVCENDQVTVVGRSGPGGRWTSTVVQLSVTRKPTVASHGGVPHQPAQELQESPSLGNWASPGVTPLQALAVPGAKPNRSFQLRVIRNSRQMLPAGLRHQVRTVLEEVDGAGRVKRKLVLHKGTRVEAAQ